MQLPRHSIATAGAARRNALEHLCRCYAMLTPREWVVMQLTMKGLRNKQIAAITVKIHKNNAMRKIGVSLAGRVRA
jgi:DNA-binding NarL/FixJ family response regulator